MTFIIPKKTNGKKKEYEQPDEGTHLGVLIDIYDCTKAGWKSPRPFHVAFGHARVQTA